MPFVSIAFLSDALLSLKRFHAFFGVTYLSMKKTGVKVGSDIIWGQGQENELLAKYYSPPGGMPNKPFYVPFRSPEDGYWKNPKYSGGVLQRARTTDKFKDAFIHSTPKTWQFTKDYLKVLLDQLPTEGERHIKIPVFDLIAWLYYSIDLPADSKSILSQFRSEFNLVDQTEFDTLFEITPLDSNFFFSEKISTDDLLILVGGIPESPKVIAATEEDLVNEIVSYIRNVELLTFPDSFIKSVYYALKSQRFAILAGKPGTGKSALVRAFSNALSIQFPQKVSTVDISVTSETTETDIIGYERLNGETSTTDFTRKLFFDGNPRNLFIVLLDEMNLAQVDHYFGRILPAIESDSPIEIPGQKENIVLPSDSYFIGTINSFQEENTRLPLSTPIKRRTNIIVVPNYLDNILQGKDLKTFSLTCRTLLEQSRRRVEKRAANGSASILDNFRLKGLSTVLGENELKIEASVLQALFEIATLCSTQPTTALTFGILQDVLDYLAITDDHIEALDHQVAQKIIPHLRGPVAVVKSLQTLLQTQATTGELSFSLSIPLLDELIATEDPVSGFVQFMY